MASLVLGFIAILVAAVPVTQERLTRFATLTGLSVTTANARPVIDHFTRLRRWRLIALALAVPVAGLTNDLFYLVLGWCAVSVLHKVRPPAPRPHGDADIHRVVWLLSLGCAMAAGVYLATDQGPTPAFLAHALVVIIVAAAISLTTRKPVASDDTAEAELAIGRWTTRALYLSGAAIAVSGALLIPGESTGEVPEYTKPMTFPQENADIMTVEKYQAPTCAWVDEMAASCRWWLVNGQPFPQAATYLAVKGEVPRPAPFVRSSDRKAVVYLHRHDRRMVYQDARGMRYLTGRLADAAVPTPTFARQSRYVALTKDGTQILDTKAWTTVAIPAVRQVHDLNESGIVVATASQVLVLDHRGKTRMSLAPKAKDEGYHLRPDGGLLAAIRDYGFAVETFDPRTGRRLSGVVPRLPDEGHIDTVLGWSKQGHLLVEDAYSEHVRYLDLTTGKTWRRKG